MDKITIERETLLPCAFCGAEAEILTIPEDHPDAGAMFVQCCNSRCMTSSALLYPLMDDVRALLVERWNRRAALAAQPAEPSMRPLPDHDNHHNALKCPYCNPRGLKFAEPAAAQPANPEPVASYWLIECKNGFTGWYTGRRLDCRFFDTDHRKACKFASKELAENEINERGHSCMTATEHVDIAAAQPAPAAVPQDERDAARYRKLRADSVTVICWQQADSIDSHFSLYGESLDRVIDSALIAAGDKP